MTNAIKALGIPWYTKEDYNACMSIMSDRKELPDTFDNWLSRAMNSEKEKITEGYTVLRVAINSKEFSSWCDSRGLNIDSYARGVFVHEAVKSYAFSQIK